MAQIQRSYNPDTNSFENNPNYGTYTPASNTRDRNPTAARLNGQPRVAPSTGSTGSGAGTGTTRGTAATIPQPRLQMKKSPAPGKPAVAPPFPASVDDRLNARAKATYLKPDTSSGNPYLRDLSAPFGAFNVPAKNLPFLQGTLNTKAANMRSTTRTTMNNRGK